MPSLIRRDFSLDVIRGLKNVPLSEGVKMSLTLSSKSEFFYRKTGRIHVCRDCVLPLKSWLNLELKSMTQFHLGRERFFSNPESCKHTVI